MTAKQGLILVSRILTVYYLTLAAYRITDLPLVLLPLFQEQTLLKNRADTYMQRFALESLAHAALIIGLDLMMALAFYQCGPRITRFLLGQKTEDGSNVGGTA